MVLTKGTVREAAIPWLGDQISAISPKILARQVLRIRLSEMSALSDQQSAKTYKRRLVGPVASVGSGELSTVKRRVSGVSGRAVCAIRSPQSSSKRPTGQADGLIADR